MKKKQRKTGVVRVPVIGGLCAIVLLLLLTLPAAKLMESGSVSVSAIKIVGYFILGTVSVTMAIVTAKTAKTKKLPCCLLASAILFTALVVLNAFLNHGRFVTIGQTALIVFIPAVAAALLFTGRKRKYG